MAGFDIDLAALRRFTDTAEGIAERVRGLKGSAASAKLAPGAFTLVPAGRRIDGAHAVMLRRVTMALDGAIEQMSRGIDNARATADAYGSTDTEAGDQFRRFATRMSQDDQTSIETQGASHENP